MKIKIDSDCGNAPKKEFLKDFNISFAAGDTAYLLKHVCEDFTWNLIGDRQFEGVQEFSDELAKMKSYKVAELHLERILSHGKEGAISGIMHMENGNRYAFSEFYEFTSAKGHQIKSLTTYVIEIK